MADIHVKVKDEEFDPPSQYGNPGDKVKFTNKRSSSAQIQLDPNFFDQSSLDIPGNDGEKHAYIKSDATDKGTFETIKVHTKKRDTMEGEILARPKK